MVRRSICICGQHVEQMKRLAGVEYEQMRAESLEVQANAFKMQMVVERVGGCCEELPSLTNSLFRRVLIMYLLLGK